MKKLAQFFLMTLLLTFVLGCSKTWEGVKDDTSKNWETTKEKTQEAWDSTKEAVHDATAD